jgi:uncharacterized protein
MANFKIKALRPDGTNTYFYYDNQESTLTWEDGTPVRQGVQKSWREFTAVSAEQPGRKGNIRVLKISLGLLCNYACTYCSQRFVPHADQTNPEDVESFLRSLEDALIEHPERIEFWGGEPLVYWKTLKPLAERLRATYPKAQFSMITNGSLLDSDKNAWIDRLGFSVGLSHDGPGYHARGADPLDDPQKRAAIFDLYARLKPEERISINAMIHANNPSRAHVQSWLRERFGEDVVIGEGAFIDPYDEGGLASTFQTSAERVTFSAYAFKELRAGTVTNFEIGRKKIMDFVESVAQGRPASALGQKCGMDRNDNLAVDLNGNVLTCQNVSAVAVAPNGESHKIGHISQLQAVKMRSATHWSKREECSSCPVLQLCKGSCMFLDGPLWKAGCDASYADNVPFLAAGIEFLTGCFPFYIEGDFPLERRDIFGLVSEHSEVKERRVIPIKVEHA